MSLFQLSLSVPLPLGVCFSCRSIVSVSLEQTQLPQAMGTAAGSEASPVHFGGLANQTANLSGLRTSNAPYSSFNAWVEPSRPWKCRGLCCVRKLIQRGSVWWSAPHSEIFSGFEALFAALLEDKRGFLFLLCEAWYLGQFQHEEVSRLGADEDAEDCAELAKGGMGLCLAEARVFF